MNHNQNLVWIDLEMTGLNPQSDVILEIATIITNGQLENIQEGPHYIIQQPEEYLAKMDPWVVETHTRSGLIDQVCSSTISMQEAEMQTLHFIKQHCPEGTALLAGNSVWQDKLFLQRYMPSIPNYLYYRIIDVTTVKELVTRWYSYDPKREFKKKETHRALDDIRESIAELQYYRSHFFVN